MQDFSNARHYAISSVGYGKGHTVEEAVANHDATVGRDYGHMLAVPVEQITLVVWHAPEGVEGFLIDMATRWQIATEYIEAEPEQIVAVRNQPDFYHRYMAENGWTGYTVLGAA